MCTKHTCSYLLCGAVGTVTGVVFGQHFNTISVTTLHVVYAAVMLFCLAAADVTCAAQQGGVKLNNVPCRLPGNVEHIIQTVKAVLYVLWHTGSWREQREMLLSAHELSLPCDENPVAHLSGTQLQHANVY